MKLRTKGLHLNAGLAAWFAAAGLFCIVGTAVIGQQPDQTEATPKAAVTTNDHTADQKADAARDDDAKGGITEEE